MTQSFALYGFPESHAISFGMLAYASTYLKVHRPTEFLAGLVQQSAHGILQPADFDPRCSPARRSHPGRLCRRHRMWPCSVESDDTLRLGL